MTVSMSDLCRLGPLEAIPPGEGRNFIVEGTEIAVFRTRAGEVYATQAHCPHRGAPLADGLVGGGRVVCPFHGYSFELSTGEPAMPSCPALKTYAVSVGPDGEIYASLEEDPQRQPCLR